MDAPLIHCPRCNGEGKLNLSGPLLRTYNAILGLQSPTMGQLAKFLGENVHPTAINRRVDRLMQMKLVRRRLRKHELPRYLPVS